MEISSISDFDQLEMIGQPMQEASERTGNILFRIQALVCRITSQLARLSQETQSRSQNMKKEYRAAYEKSADLTKEQGDYSPIIAGLSLASTGVCYLTSAYIGKEKADSFSLLFREIPGAVQSCGQMKMSYLSAESAKATAVKDLRSTELQNESTKSGEARDLQSELQQILGNIRELYKKASN